jgi:predicted AlkP superfamily phosphohydrolase/phosphomutase
VNGSRIAILAALFAVVGPVGAESAHKVLVLGVDGLDPKLLQSYVDQGKLPNFKRLIAEGDFKPLQTSMPPLSPVAWSTFITGMDPGGHGVFDFIHRDAATMAPRRAEAGTEEGKNVALPGCAVLPFGGGSLNLRQGTAFWQILEEHDVPTTVFRMPANFPPVESKGRSLSGMGTPDIRGTPGVFSFYTDRRVPNAKDLAGGAVYPVKVKNNRVKGRLYGPYDPFHNHDKPECAKKPEHEIEYLLENAGYPRLSWAGRLHTDFEVFLDPELPVAKIVTGDEEIVLQQGEWSEWIRVDFEALPLLASVSAIGRFYLKQVRPKFELYVTPLQIDPENPGAMPLSTPGSWSQELCEELGYFYTQELPADTRALQEGILTGREFWQQTQHVHSERRKAFDHLIEGFDEGMLFFYFTSVDQDSHMLWRYMDPEHPGFVEDEVLRGGIETIYKEIDEVVGQALKVVDDDTTLIVMSDHGFAPFKWQVNLNTWLLEKGYVALRNPANQGKGIWFSNVDWSRTKAYAVGLNGLYINLRGREPNGIVQPGKEHDDLLARLETDLLELVDPRNGHRVVSLVTNTRRDFHGPLAGEGPDLLVGYNWGYRNSWKSPLGWFPKEIFLDNEKPWSGDHSMDYRQVPGVLISNRPITLDSPALYDLTVAILDEYGIPKPEEMIGSDCLGENAP